MAEQSLQSILNHFGSNLGRIERLLLKNTRATAAVQAEVALLSRGQKPRMPIEFMGQFGQDVMLWGLFKKKTDGFFIEAGAFDGYRFSPTYALEAMGWNGLLVEAIPHHCQECARRRPNSKVVNAALSADDSSGPTQLWVVEDIYGGMLSYTGRSENALLNDIGNTPRKAVSVPTATLNSLLADHQGEIDLVVLDVEGDELLALQGFDLRRFKPRMLLIEDNTKGGNKVLREYMENHGYAFLGPLGVDQLFIHKDQTELLQEHKWLGIA